MHSLDSITMERLSRRNSLLASNLGGSKQMSQPLLSNLDSVVPDDKFGAFRKTLRSRAVFEAELDIRPNRLDLGSLGDSDAGHAAHSSPVGGALELELLEHRIDRLDKMSDLLGGVTRSGGDTESLLSHGDGRVVDRLNVDLVLGQKHVGGFLGEGSITHEDRQDVRRVWDDRNVERLELTLDFTSIQLLQTAISLEFALVRDRSLSTGNNRGRKRSSEDESGSVRPDDIDEIGGSSNVSTNDAICFT